MEEKIKCDWCLGTGRREDTYDLIAGYISTNAHDCYDSKCLKCKGDGLTPIPKKDKPQ